MFGLERGGLWADADARADSDTLINSDNLAQPDAMTRTCQISSGPVSGAEYSKQLFLDTLIHGWDIAIGSKQDARLDDYLVQVCMPLAQAIADNDGYRGAFATPINGNATGNPQTSLLGLLGRTG